MNVNQTFSPYLGEWKGTNDLYLTSDPASLRQSESKLSVSFKANGQFVAFDYTWAYDGQPQEGLIIVGGDRKSDAVQAVWTDSWHSSHTFMVSDGKRSEDGSVSVKGYYKVEGHPDWGWRTDIVPGGETLRIVMYNVSPEGEEDLAVETEYRRI